ncbi:type VI secretion system-associated FHA domain protein TagH [Ancylobacter amanitiformis]|uniref:Type VI secretion system FHA domain protein n=1 Tax=Ancylobacter amanitiformis TaxID=217069 RepID=A0ABU0LL67_9HYPH|nr:type VI secretion system-associated FHA domain protein TagH [Ancylobacter amanitiformis]MDQ0509449.1 type VI secretion system FHA domain protein [Ancylobacter amanitiformis]
MFLRARLTVSSEQRQSLGAHASRDFDEAGGFIGRSATCDWRLPDSTHTVSARHAEIRFNGHGFVVVDLSTNGVYLNTTDAPLGRGNSAVLVTGDTLYMGVYVLQVEVLRAEAGPRSSSDAGLAELPPASPRLDPLWQAPAARPAVTYRAPGAPRPMDPLDALDGAEGAPEGDNPFAELGLAGRSGDSTSEWRDLLDSRSRPAPSLSPVQDSIPRGLPSAPPLPAQPFAGATPVIRSDAAPGPVSGLPARAAAGGASATPSPIPAAPAAPPAFPPQASGHFPAPLPAQRLAPAIPAPAFASAAAEGEAPDGGIPPNFLDELSTLFPQLLQPSDAPAGDPPPEAPPSGTPLAISRGVSTRNPPEAGLAAADPVSLLRQRAAARSGVAGQTVPDADERRPDALALGDAYATIPRDVPQDIPPAPRPSPPETPLPPGGSAAGSDPAEPLWTLLGLDGPSLSPQARAVMFADVAGLLREMADGLVSVLEARRLIKDGFHLDQTQLRPAENNPFKFCASGREALDKVLIKRPPGFLAADDAARAGFDDVKAHEMATMDAMQATIARLVQRISPAAITFELEEEAARNPGLFSRKLDKARLWDRYLAMHERLVDSLDVVGPEVTGEELARAYARHSQDLHRRDT